MAVKNTARGEPKAAKGLPRDVPRFEVHRSWCRSDKSDVFVCSSSLFFFGFFHDPSFFDEKEFEGS